MSNFRTKILGLVGLAVVFAGASYGQQITSCSNGITVGGVGVTAEPGPLSLRAESTSDLVADYQFQCVNNGAAATGNGTVQIFMNAPVTSKLLTDNTGRTEAALFLCATAAACYNTSGNALGLAATSYGFAAGNVITFNGLTFPAGANFYAHVSNVRVNASAITLSSTLTSVTGTALASANDTSAATSAATLGYVFKSLAAPTITTTPNGAGSPGVTPYTTCVGNALPAVGNLNRISFMVSLAESGQGGFFKLQIPTATASGEQGSFQGVFGSGTATFGTRIMLNLGNVPSAVTLYVPSTITVATPSATGTPFTLTLVSGQTTGSAAVPGVTVSTATGAPVAGAVGVYPGINSSLPAGYTETIGASVAITPANNTAMVVYEVSSDDKSIIDAANIPVFATFSSGAFQTVQGPITVVEGYAPQFAAASATTIPNFVPVTAPVLNATVINVCQTNLLFPFVTSQLGFDTGIALSNTSADPFGTALSPGSCTLNFYGNGAPTPSTNVPAPGGSQTGGSSNAFLLSSVAAGFQGYVIAQCNYQFGHGFAYISYGLGQASATAMGYVAQILPNRGTGAVSESLGQ